MYDLSQLNSDPDRVGRSSDEASVNQASSWAAVPWRTIVGAVGVVLVTAALVLLVLAAVSIITLTLIAGFFAAVLAPVVSRVQRRVRDRRGLATGIVVLSTLAAMTGAAALFLVPVRTQLIAIISDLPGTVHQAAQGKGPIGNIVKGLHIENYVKNNEAALSRAASRLDDQSFQTAQTAQTVLSAALAFVTVTLLTFFFLSQSEAMGKAVINVLPRRRRASVRRGAVDAAAAVSGYVIGNLLVSLVAGVTAFALLVILGVPSPVVLALFVAVADVIPLVGATIGAGIAVVAAYLHSPTAGLTALIFFIVYQQVENGVIYPWIMARKLKVNPLVILLSVLLGVELSGMLGALCGDQEDRTLQRGDARQHQVQQDERVGIERVTTRPSCQDVDEDPNRKARDRTEDERPRPHAVSDTIG